MARGDETDSSLDYVKMKFNMDQEPVLYCSSTDPIPQVQMGESPFDLEAKYLMENVGDSN